MPHKIYFIEEGHSYFYGTNRLISGTSFLKKFSPEFDHVRQSTISAIKKLIGDEKYKRIRKEIFSYNFNPNLEDIKDLFIDLSGGETIVEEIKNNILQEWEDSGPKGTKFHKQMELEYIDIGYEINPYTGNKLDLVTFDKMHDNEVYDMDLYKCPDGFYVEFLAYHKDIPLDKTICGTIDKLFIETIDGVRYTWTDDWKTNSSEPTESKFEKMLPPLEHLYSNKHTDYVLQASIYQSMLKSHGFTPMGSSYTWIDNYDKQKSKQKLFSLKLEDIDASINYYKNVNNC